MAPLINKLSLLKTAAYVFNLNFDPPNKRLAPLSRLLWRRLRGGAMAQCPPKYAPANRLDVHCFVPFFDGRLTGELYETRMWIL